MNDDFVAGADHYRAMAMATADVDHKALLLFIADGLQAIAERGNSAAVVPDYLRLPPSSPGPRGVGPVQLNRVPQPRGRQRK
jgi:hypothetical protein